MNRSAFAMVLVWLALPLAAQELVVSKSPVSPNTSYALSGDAFEQPLLAVRLEAIGGDVTVEGFELTLSGTGSPVTQMTGLSVWLDDGDGEFDAQLDTALWSGPSSAVVTVALAPTVLVGDGLFVDIWVVANFAPDAGSSLGLTYSVGIAATSDVTVESGATVTFDAVSPQSNELALVLFRVDNVIHRTCGVIIIEGSGFTPPLDVMVWSSRIHGVFDVSADHSHVVFEYEMPSPIPWISPLELSTALVTRYQTSHFINFRAVCGLTEPGDPSGCAVNRRPNSKAAILLLAALMCGVGRLAVARASRVIRQ